MNWLKRRFVIDSYRRLTYSSPFNTSYGKVEFFEGSFGRDGHRWMRIAFASHSERTILHNVTLRLTEDYTLVLTADEGIRIWRHRIDYDLGKSGLTRSEWKLASKSLDLHLTDASGQLNFVLIGPGKRREVIINYDSKHALSTPSRGLKPRKFSFWTLLTN